MGNAPSALEGCCGRDKITVPGKEAPAPEDAWSPPENPHIFSFSANKELKVPSQYATISEALEAAKTGDKIVIAPGNYSDSLRVTKSLEITGETGSVPPTIEASSVTALFIDGGATQVRLSNLKLVVSESRGNFDNVVDNKSAFLVMEDCELIGGHWGVLVYEKGSAVLRRSTIKGCKDHGIFAKDKAQLWVSHCEVCDHGQSGINVHGEDCSCTIVDSKVRGCKANGVLVYGRATLRMKSNQVSGNSHAGICVSDLHTHAEITGNRICDNGLQGIYVWEGGGAVIRSNDLRGNLHWSVSVAADCQANVTCSGNIE